MKISCLGGFREVGRNGVVIDTGKSRILLDYGIKVETGEIPIKAQNITALLLSHAHLDHSGMIPTVKAEIYGTAATLDQAHLLLEDSIKVAKKKNLPIRFSKNDIRRMKEFIVTYGQEFEIEDTTIEVYDAGHVPGSAGFLLNSKKRIFYTGDFKLSETRLLRGANYKEIDDVDVLITESTYAYKEHPPREAVEEKLIEIIEETIANDGNVLIPVFAVGRAAEILLVLHAYKIKYPIYLDGMAKEATEIIMRYPELLKDHKALKKALERVVPLYTAKDRKIALKGPSIIVTTAGMLSGGPVIHFLKKLRKKEECSLVFTGFQVPGTPGRDLLETGIYSNENVSFKVKMNIKYLDFSAHSSRTELLELIEHINPEKIIVMHGDNCEEFAAELNKNGYTAFAPKNGDRLEV